MNARIYFILTFTFITGMFAGAYLYVTVFAPDYQRSDVENLTEIDFRIQGQMIGGCQMAGVCPSFVLNQNRTYEYVPAYKLKDGEPEKVIGKLDTDTFTAMLEKAQSANMEILTKTNSLNCRSDVDGDDYQYHVTLDGETYDLNTCGMNFKNSALDQSFQSLWTQLATPHNEPGLFDDGIDGFFKNQLDKKFKYDE